MHELSPVRESCSNVMQAGQMRKSASAEVFEQTIGNIRQRNRAGGIEAVLTDKRQALKDEQAAHLIAIACSEVPDGHDHWTVRMLAGKAIDLRYVPRLSPETVRQLLKKTR